MAQEEKDLLLKDLCARLPYGLWIDDGYALAIHIDYSDVHFENYFNGILNGDVKPYLRQMSSMTEEERSEYALFYRAFSCSLYEKESVERVDWLNKHHFDYRGLIEKGLALEAKEEMYKF